MVEVLRMQWSASLRSPGEDGRIYLAGSPERLPLSTRLHRRPPLSVVCAGAQQTPGARRQGPTLFSGRPEAPSSRPGEPGSVGSAHPAPSCPHSVTRRTLIAKRKPNLPLEARRLLAGESQLGGMGEGGAITQARDWM